jgi:hypothetical protein
MKRARSIGLPLFAIFAFSAVGTTAAQAAGPVWITGARKVELRAREAKRISTYANLSNFRFKNGTTVVECGKVSKGARGGEIIGGNPGTDAAEILFKECRNEARPRCLATSTRPAGASGEIITSVKTLLAYPKNRTNGEAAVDVFFPQEASNTFSVFKFENERGSTECGILNGVEVTVTAAGEEVEIPTFKERRKCGVIAEVGKAEGGRFVRSRPGEVASKGALNFPSTKITEAEYWTGAAFSALRSCKLEAFGMVDEEIGESDITLEGEEVFGWEI